jgi:hypothetical protein
MSRKRHTPEEIVTNLRQVEVLTAQGRPVAEAVRSSGVTEVTYGAATVSKRLSRSLRPGIGASEPGRAVPADGQRSAKLCIPDQTCRDGPSAGINPHSSCGVKG